MHYLAQFLYFLSKFFRKVGRKIDPNRTKWYDPKILKKWKEQDKDKHFRTNYDLNEDSVVFDLGGYKGEWSSDIFSIYLPFIHVFEINPDFAKKLSHKFKLNSKIYINGFGLGSENLEVNVSELEDASSIYLDGDHFHKGTIKEFGTYIQENKINAIDLIKINIEGAEYDLLDHLLDTGIINHINNIQVQFHPWVVDAEKRMNKIQTRLSQTHKLTYQFYFFWENWRIKNN